MQLPKLNLPPHLLQTKQEAGKLWLRDVIRKKWLVARPEEWVRQQLLAHMVHDLGYPKQYLRVEGRVMVQNMPQRYDIALFDALGSILLIAECKAPQIAINDNVLRQSSGYLHYTGAIVLLITNGLSHVSLLKTKEGPKTSPHLLNYEEMIRHI